MVFCCENMDSVFLNTMKKIFFREWSTWRACCLQVFISFWNGDS